MVVNTRTEFARTRAHRAALSSHSSSTLHLTHFLPPPLQQPKVSTLVLPLIEEGDPVLRDCGFLAKFDMDDEPSLASGSTRWALPQFA